MEKSFKQFNKLQSVSPNEQWLKNTRNFLVAQVDKDTLTKQVPWASQFRLGLLIWIRKLTPSPVKAVSTLIIIGLIGGTNFVAQAEYIPTRPLYAVKKTIEKLELVLAMSPESETKVYLKHATERKNEAVKLAQNQGFTTQEKDENIKTVAKSLAKDISAAQSSLDIVKDNTNTAPGETAQLAKQITQNVQENIQALNEVKVAASSQNVDQTVTEVQNTIELAENASLAVLIDSAQNDKVNKDIISKDEVKQILNNKINRTSDKIQEMSKKVDAIDATAVEKNETPTEVKKVVTELAERSTEAQKILGDAKQLLETGSLAETLDKVKESTDIVDKSKDILVKAENADAIKDATAINSSTSTEGIIKGQGALGSGTKNIINDKGIFNQTKSSSSPETTPNILNYAPLGGPINQTASYTEEYLPEDTDQESESIN